MIKSAQPPKTVVLLHGFVSSSQYWSRLAPLLEAAGYQVIRIDLLGFGKAPKPHNIDYSYDDHISYIHKRIQELEITPFLLVGHSMGALLAARYSKLYPDNIHALALLNPPLYKDSVEARAVLRKTGRFYRFLLDSPYRNIGWKLLRLSIPRFIKAHSNSSRDRSLANIIEKPEIFDDLAEITIPTLLVVGLKDRPEYLANLALIKHVQPVSITIENVDHHGTIKNPQIIASAIQKFLSRRP